MRARGIPQYTQHSVAFPTSAANPRNDGVVDEIGVEFNAKGGGCYGSGISFEFHVFDRSMLGRETTGLEISGWGDGIANLMDDRIQRVLARLHRQSQARNRRARYGHSDLDATPAQVIAALEAEGIRPSGYQLRALGTAREDMPKYVLETDSL